MLQSSCAFVLLRCAALFAVFQLGLLNLPAQSNEVRALWVDAFGSGFKSSSEVTSLLNDARAGHFNAIVAEVRKRGDAYYNSNYEPKASDISSSFDPLQDMITKGHDTSGGKQRVEIHAWIVTYPIGNTP